MSRLVHYDSNGNEIAPPKADVIRQTNADRIRAMTDEDLAEKLTWIVPYCGDCSAKIGNGKECLKDCEKAWLDWLRQEAE